MNNIKGRIYKPDGKTEQNYKARLFKKVENIIIQCMNLILITHFYSI
jgi:hypothetical protein